jgi:hypothetical protein
VACTIALIAGTSRLWARLQIKRLKSTQDRGETIEAIFAPCLAEIADPQCRFRVARAGRGAVSTG